MSKSQFRKYILLDKLFRSKKGYTKEEILEIIKEKIKQNGDRNFYKDIKAFEEMGAKFETENYVGHNEKIYQYKDLNFSIFSSIADDIELLYNTIGKLDCIKGNIQLDVLRLQLMSIAQNRDINTHPIIEFDHNKKLEGSARIEMLAKAIMGKKTLILHYKPFIDEMKKDVIHPYHLRQYNNRWFLLAYSEDDNKINIYAIDRIIGIKDAKKPFKSTDINWETYFKDVVGVTISHDKKPEKVMFRVSKSSYTDNYVRTKPIHSSQIEIKEKETDEHAYFQIQVIPNKELEMQFMSYSDSIEVIEPLYLRQLFAEKARNMFESYKDGFFD